MVNHKKLRATSNLALLELAARRGPATMQRVQTVMDRIKKILELDG